MKNRSPVSAMQPSSNATAGRGLLLPALAALLAFSASGDYTITWSKVSGGGGTSTNGLYSASGTICQEDARGASTNGAYLLTGGFWAIALVQTPGAPRLHMTNASPGYVTIWWTPSTIGYVLQSAGNMAPTDWSVAPSGTNNPVTVFATGPARFYRLAKP